jgi:hypothetical protein
LPRDLADVLHYFLPEDTPDSEIGPIAKESRPSRLAPSPGAIEQATREKPPHRADRVRPAVDPPHRLASRPTLPIVTIPIGEQDVVRAAFAWNLTVEVVRLGARATLLTPDLGDSSPLWPESGNEPLGAELVRSPARDMGGLYRAAVDLAMTRASDAREGGLVIVRVPPKWLRAPGDGHALLDWMLLFSACDEMDLRETYGIAKLLVATNARASIGITIHGAKQRKEADAAFSALARSARENLARDLVSYGLLVDDLHVYRAIVAQRPIGLAHPQSPAARGLRDVAGLLLEDARKRTLVQHVV